MKFLITLFLSLLLTFQALAISGTPNNYSIGKTLKVSNEFIQGTSKVDGGFESSTTAWNVSVGTIVRTANTEMQGNYVGVWSGTGTGTLDLLWTATASNTYELSAQIKLDVPSDYTLCGVVNGVETGCKVLSGYVANKIYKASVFADSVLGTSFYLRLKHTGAGAFSATVDDGKIEPWTPQSIGVVEQEILEVSGNGGTSTTANVTDIPFVNTTKNTLSNLGSWTNNTTFTAKKKVSVVVSAMTVWTTASANSLIIYKNGFRDEKWGTNNSTQIPTINKNFDLNAGDYFTIRTDGNKTLSNDPAHRFNITATAISENIVQSWQDGTEWTSYTPTFGAGFGTVSPSTNQAKWKRVGSDIYVEAFFTLGTTTNALFSISLPSGLNIDASKIIASNTTSGIGQSVGRFEGSKIYMSGAVVTAVGTSTSLVYLGANTENSTDILIPHAVASSYISSAPMSVKFKVPIQGWSSTPTLLALPTSKENVFSAKISSTGTRTGQNIDWINSVTVSDTSLYTIDITKLGLSVPPQVNANITGTWTSSNAPRWATVQSVSSSLIVIRTHSLASGLNVYEAWPFEIKIQKQSPDYTAPGVFISNLNPDGFNRTTGTTGLIDNFSFSYGTTNATTVCSASPCSYLDQIGTYVTSVTRAVPGDYTANFSKTYSKLKCTSQSSGQTIIYNTRLSCENCNSLRFVAINSSSGLLADVYGNLVCQGY